MKKHIAGQLVGDPANMRWTSQDPKYDIQIINGVPRQVNSGSGVPVPLDVPIFTTIGHDLRGAPAVMHYKTLCVEGGDPQEHLDSIQERIEAFVDFASENPTRMKRPRTTARPVGSEVAAAPV